MGFIPIVGPAIEEPGNLVAVVEDFDLEVHRFLGLPLNKEGGPVTRQDGRSRSIGLLNVGQQIVQIAHDGSHIFVRTSGYHLSDSAKLNIMWQVSDYDAKGVNSFNLFPTSGSASGARATGSLITTQLSVKF